MRFDFDAYRHRITYPVRFSDLDAMGHVNNARILTFFEEGRAGWCCDCLGLPQGSTDYPFIVARIEIDYRHPIPFGVECSTLTRASRLGGKSLVLEGAVTIHSEEGEQVASTYKCTAVFFDYKQGQSVALPDEVKETIRKYEPAL